MTLDITVPFWGDPQYLFDTVHSVQAQTDPDWRLVVIDDAYPDPRVAEFFADLDDPRIEYRRHAHNVGIVANFRACVAAARAERMLMLGSDDLLRPDFVSTVRRAAAQFPEVDIIQPGVEVIDAAGTPTLPLVDRVKQRVLAPRAAQRPVTLTGEPLATSLIRGDWLYWPSLVFRTETIASVDFRDDLPIILDLALLMDLAFRDASLVALAEPVFAYRRHTESASQTSLLTGRRFDDERRFYGETARAARDRGWNRTARAARVRLISRLHAVTELPVVMRRGSRDGVRAALRHIFR